MVHPSLTIIIVFFFPLTLKAWDQKLIQNLYSALYSISQAATESD